jgi:hypothetical protein
MNRLCLRALLAAAVASVATGFSTRLTSATGSQSLRVAPSLIHRRPSSRSTTTMGLMSSLKRRFRTFPDDSIPKGLADTEAASRMSPITVGIIGGTCATRTVVVVRCHRAFAVLTDVSSNDQTAPFRINHTATGAVGEEIMGCLKERGIPVSDIVLFASERSAGKVGANCDRGVRPSSSTRRRFVVRRPSSCS